MEKNSTIADEVITVLVANWYYKFIYSNGTSITFNYDNYTNMYLTLFTGVRYMLNITNIGTSHHGMAFTNTITNQTPYDFDITGAPAQSNFNDFVLFNSSANYFVTCRPLGSCGQYHNEMNFYVQVIDKPVSVTGSITSNGTVTLTDFIERTSFITKTRVTNKTTVIFQNVTIKSISTVTAIQTQTQTQTQSLSSWSAAFMFITFFSFILVFNGRKKNM